MFIFKDATIANETILSDPNTLSALFALPTVRVMQVMGMDAIETAEYINRLWEKGEVLPCFRLIQFLISITGHENAALLNSLSDSPESMEQFVGEFLTDLDEILSGD